MVSFKQEKRSESRTPCSDLSVKYRLLVAEEGNALLQPSVAGFSLKKHMKQIGFIDAHHLKI